MPIPIFANATLSLRKHAPASQLKCYIHFPTQHGNRTTGHKDRNGIVVTVQGSRERGIRETSASRGRARKTRIGHYLFRLHAVALSMRSDTEGPLVTVELAKYRVRVSVLPKRRVRRGDKVRRALASRLKLGEKLIVRPSARGHKAIWTLDAIRTVGDRSQHFIVAHGGLGGLGLPL